MHVRGLRFIKRLNKLGKGASDNRWESVNQFLICM